MTNVLLLPDGRVISGGSNGIDLNTIANRWEKREGVRPIIIDEADLATHPDWIAAQEADASEKNNTLRNKEKAKLDNIDIIKALALVIMDEINLLRAEHSLAPRTEAQIIPAIKSKLDTL